jgi:hypothetical protein
MSSFRRRLVEQTPGDRGASSKFIFNPTNKVIGIIDDAGDALLALRALRSAGFTAEEVELLTDEEGAQRVDLTGEGREVLVHIIRPAQQPQEYYDAPRIVRQIEQELKAGHYGIGVGAKDREARERVRGILKSHNGHFINFYGQWAAEALEP